MITGWWLEGADKTLDEVVDTQGLVWRITGEYPDGSLELETVFDADGYAQMERWGAQPDITSDYDPAPIDPHDPYAPLGRATLEF